MVLKNNKKDINMLEGPLLPKIVSFVIPLMIANLLQVCYSAADMIVVGLSGVEGVIGSIGTTNAMINLIINVFVGFSIGGNVFVARCLGKGDDASTEKAVHTSVAATVLAGFLCMALGLCFSRPILAWLGDEGHILDLATVYTRYYFAGVPFLAASNSFISIFRAKGDTKTPLYVLTATGLLNVALNLFFVLACRMSVDGVALATLIANAASALILGLILSRDRGPCRFSLRKLSLDGPSLREIFRIGFPAGLQGALFSLSNMIIQSSVISLNNAACPGGSAIIDGNAAASSIEGFVYTATNSVYQAAVTFTSQHYGAGKFRRIGRVMRSCYFVTGVVATVAVAIVVFFRRALVSLYVDDSLAVETAIIRIYIMIVPYILLAFMEVGSGIVRGLGRSLLSTVVSLIGSCLLRIIWISVVFKAFPTLEIVYLSYPISWLITAAAHFVCACSLRKKEMAAHPEAEPQTR